MIKIKRGSSAATKNKSEIVLDGTSIGLSKTHYCTISAENIIAEKLTPSLMGSLIFSTQGTRLDESWIGRRIVLLGKEDAEEYHASVISRNSLDDHSHSDIIKNVIELAEGNRFVRSGDHLTELCGLKRQVSGGDFQTEDEETSRGGDLKFYPVGNKPICLCGSINVEKIKQQAEMLIIARYQSKKDPHHIVAVQALNVWDVIPNAESLFADITKKYQKWVKAGRPRDDGEDVSFENELGKILLHENDPDRFYIHGKVINQYATTFYTKAGYKVAGVEEWIDQLSSEVGIDLKVISTTPKSVQQIKVKMDQVLSDIGSEKFVIAWYQRPECTTEAFILRYVVETVFGGLTLERGLFMFHDINGKRNIVDGQQRIMVAIRQFFIGGNIHLDEIAVEFEGKTLNLSGRSWSEILKMAESSDIMKRFVNMIMSREFSVRLYGSDWSYDEVATEYHIANSGKALKRQEIRASMRSALGDIVRWVTTPEFRSAPHLSDATRELLSKSLKLFDTSLFVRKGDKLKDYGIETKRMNLDKFISQCYHRVNSWGPGYNEGENDMDKLYQSELDYDDALARWKKLESYLSLLELMSDFMRKNSKRCQLGKDRKKRIFTGKEEWDLVMFLILELMKKYPNNAVTVNQDVISKMLEHHFPLTEDKKTKEETTYGMSVRKENRSYGKIQRFWFNRWQEFLLTLNKTQLKDFGFIIN